MASGRYVTSLMVISLTLLCSGIGLAQSSANEAAPDISPTLLIETGPSDNPDYRRMVFVNYLNADAVTVAYVAYNRTEFIQVPDDTPAALISACQNGPASTLEQIHAYRDQDAKSATLANRQRSNIFASKMCSTGSQETRRPIWIRFS